MLADTDALLSRERTPTVNPDLSIVIVSWNTRDLLARCLESCLGLRVAGRIPPVTEPSREVFVVDNASGDGSPEMVRQRFPQVRLIANRVNLGFAAASNQAIRLSQGRYILLLNPDTRVHAGALRTLVDFMDLHPEVGAAGAMLVDERGALQDSCSPMPTLLGEAWRLFHLDAIWRRSSYPMAAWPHDVPREVDVVQGACMLLRREALAQVGLLDEDYFVYTEEVDLCFRLHSHGWKVYWVPQARVTHHGGQSTRQIAREMFLSLYRTKMTFFRKRYGAASGGVYKLVLLLAAGARVLLTPLALLETPAKRQAHLAVSGHYRALIRLLPSI